MQNAECRMQNAECGMRNPECGKRNAESGMKWGGQGRESCGLGGDPMRGAEGSSPARRADLGHRGFAFIVEYPGFAFIGEYTGVRAPALASTARIMVLVWFGEHRRLAGATRPFAPARRRCSPWIRRKQYQYQNHGKSVNDRLRSVPWRSASIGWVQFNSCGAVQEKRENDVWRKHKST